MIFAITSYPVPPLVPGGPQEPWGPSRVVREMVPGRRAPQAHRVGVPGALGPAGPGHGSPCCPPGSRRKRPRTPKHLGAFRGPSKGPGYFSLTHPPRGLWGPRSSWGPAVLGAPAGAAGARGSSDHRGGLQGLWRTPGLQQEFQGPPWGPHACRAAGPQSSGGPQRPRDGCVRDLGSRPRHPPP